jgi:hypothetical protein
VLATWIDGGLAGFPFEASHITSQGINTYTLPLNGNIDPKSSALVLGENGTAFATDGASFSPGVAPTIVSFNINSGSVNWSYQAPSQSSLSIISSSENSGLLVQQTDQAGHLTTVTFDAIGNATSLPFSTMNIAPWVPGSWIGVLNNSIAEFADPNAPLPPAGWDRPQGNRQNQDSPQLPIIHTFIPEPYVCLMNTSPCQPDPSSPKALADFLKNRYAGKAELLGFPSSSATYPTFQKDIQRPIQAFGFIGHSFTLGAPRTSVGLCFYIQDPQYTRDCIVQHDYFTTFDQPSNPTIKPEDVIKLQTQPKVIFIAACETQDVFEKLWDIDQNTKGRALIIPQVNVLSPGAVDLTWGATVWTAVLDSLLQGSSVADAVKAGNTAATSKNSQYTWQVIGDGNVKIAQASN